MKKCRFSEPDIIASYYDDTLAEKDRTEFEAHLYTCRNCMDALLSLEQDLFFMGSMGRMRISASSVRRAFFKITAGGIRLLKNLEGPAFFMPVPAVSVRGKKGERYRLEKGGLAVEVKGAEKRGFDIEVSGIRGKKTCLYLTERLVEARAHPKKNTVFFYNLEKGFYKLCVEGEDILEFSVGEEVADGS